MVIDALPPKVTARLVPGLMRASPGAWARAIVARPTASGVSVLSALARRMRTRAPPTDTRTRLRTVASLGPPVASPVGDAPHAAIHCGAAAALVGPAAQAAATAASAATARLTTRWARCSPSPVATDTA